MIDRSIYLSLKNKKNEKSDRLFVNGLILLTQEKPKLSMVAGTATGSSGTPPAEVASFQPIPRVPVVSVIVRKERRQTLLRRRVWHLVGLLLRLLPQAQGRQRGCLPMCLT